MIDMKDYSMFRYFKGENDNPFDQESQNNEHMFWFYESHFENLFNRENNDHWRNGFADSVNRKFRSVIAEVESKGSHSKLKTLIFDTWLNDYLFIDKLTSWHKDQYNLLWRK